MTADHRRRRRSAAIASVAAVLGLFGAAGLGLVGLNTVLNSSVGSDVGVESARRPELPFTVSGLLGVVDDEGQLASAVVMGLEPDGTGGYLVPLTVDAATVDPATLDGGGQPRTLRSAYADRGAQGLRSAAESVTMIGFDLVEVVDDEALANLLDRLGEFEVDLDDEVTDDSTDVTFPTGEQRLTPTELAELVTAVDADVDDRYVELARRAAWSAVADRVGAGVGTVSPVATERVRSQVSTIEELTERLFASTVSYRSLELVTAGEAVVHDPAATLMVMSVVAPARVGAPLEGPTVRVVAPRGTLDPVAHSAAVHRAVEELLDAGINVVSVSLDPNGELGASTELLGVDRDAAAAAEEMVGGLFGVDSSSVEASLPVGVEVELRLGADWLDDDDR